jgi:Lrp/AsnC family leucine-responsive transcriptional regulator|tara:strand:- start:681 stop:1133 length:453 start_codon:yes stop_codon:yes gene_type:complete
MDEYDRKILSVLSVEGRISMTALGERVGLSKTPVTARVKRLEEDGVITGYCATLSASKLGVEHIAFLEVKLSDTREKALDAFNQAVRAIPEVEACHMIAGGFDYLIKVRTSDIFAYRQVLGEQLSRLPNVASTSTYISMQSVVDTAPIEL